MSSYPWIPAPAQCIKACEGQDSTSSDPMKNGEYCAQCSEQNRQDNNTGVRYGVAKQMLKVFEISNPNASLVLLNDIKESSAKLLEPVIIKLFNSAYTAVKVVEGIKAFKRGVYIYGLFAQSFQFKPFIAPPIPPPPRGRTT